MSASLPFLRIHCRSHAADRAKFFLVLMQDRTRTDAVRQGAYFANAWEVQRRVAIVVSPHHVITQGPICIST